MTSGYIFHPVGQVARLYRPESPCRIIVELPVLVTGSRRRFAGTAGSVDVLNDNLHVRHVSSPVSLSPCFPFPLSQYTNVNLGNA